MPKISYIVTCSNETSTLSELLNCIWTEINSTNDELVIVLDSDCKNNSTTVNIICDFYNECDGKSKIKCLEHPLANDYGAHKNWAIEQTTGNWIFQLDGDELPYPSLISNIKEIIEFNPNVEAFAVPRINDFRGVTPEDARIWGWSLVASPACDNRLIVNWPDYQFRVFLKSYPRISYKRRLHEKIEGYTTYSALPVEISPTNDAIAIYHNKTIEQQRNTNLRYNKLFTKQENEGYTVPV